MTISKQPCACVQKTYQAHRHRADSELMSDTERGRGRRGEHRTQARTAAQHHSEYTDSMVNERVFSLYRHGRARSLSRISPLPWRMLCINSSVSLIVMANLGAPSPSFNTTGSIPMVAGCAARISERYYSPIYVFVYTTVRQAVCERAGRRRGK